MWVQILPGHLIMWLQEQHDQMKECSPDEQTVVTEDETYLMILLQRLSTLSSWSVWAVWAASFWVCDCVCICVWEQWVWERVWKYLVTQESNVAACGFLSSSIVVEGDMFSWGKACPVLLPPPTPHTLPPHLPVSQSLTLFPHPPHLCSGDIFIAPISLSKQWEGKTTISRRFALQCFFVSFKFNQFNHVHAI